MASGGAIRAGELLRGAPRGARADAPDLFWRIAPLVLLTLTVWGRIFSTWFAQDDFRWLHRAGAGVTSLTPRLLSMGLYFKAMRAVFGLHPAPYHVVQLLLHLAAGLLLFSILRSRLPANVSAWAAAIFLSAPALFDAIHWISDIADILTCAFLLLAVWLLTRPAARARAGWFALFVYAISLLSKEIAVGAAPVLAILQWRAGDRFGRLRAGLCVGLAALAAVQASGAWQTGSGEPYHLSAPAMLANLPALVSAAVLGAAAWSSGSDLAWSRHLWVQVAGWTLLAIWLIALIFARSRTAWLGFLWFVCLLGPVLPLADHFYLYYVDCALPGLVVSLAFLAVSLGALRGRWWPVLAAVWVVAQGVAIEARQRSRLPTVPLPTDFVLRRSEIARNVIEDLQAQEAMIRPQMVFLGQQPLPTSSSGTRVAGPSRYRPDPWLDENVRGALSEGEAVTLMFPQVRDVSFARWLEARDTSSVVAAYEFDGHLRLFDYATFLGVPDIDAPVSREEHVARAQRFLSRRLFLEARRELEVALGLAPRDPTILLNLGAVQAQMGDSAAALATLSQAVSVAPDDPEALFDLGLLDWRLGRTAAARSNLERLERVAPNSDLARSVRDLLNGKAK